MTGSLSPLRIGRRTRDGVVVVEPAGVLDLACYARLRDLLVACALELPRAVVVDMRSLRVPTEATLAVFTTVRQRVAEWPGVPLLLVAPDPAQREGLAGALNRRVPVFPNLREALAALEGPASRRKELTDLPDGEAAPLAARRLVRETCRRWGLAGQLVQDAVVVVNALVDNVFHHTAGNPSVRLELRGGLLTVAVYDGGEIFDRDRVGLGLTLVEGLARAWGCAGTPPAGKVVWAVLCR